MATALFCTEEKLKAFTGIDENVNPVDLYPHVLMAQDNWIQTTLGTKLYNKIKDLVVDKMINGTPIPTDYKTLLDDYISPTVVHYAYYSALPYLKYKTTNKGILSGTSEVAQSISLDELQYLRNSVFDNAKFYNESLRDYLCAYSNLYPEYMSYTNKDGMAPDKSTAYTTGLVIPKSKYGKNCNCAGSCNCNIGANNYQIN